MTIKRIFGFLLAVTMLLPTVLAGCSVPQVTPTEPPVTDPASTEPTPTEPEKEVYHGMTPSQLDAIPGVNYNDFRKNMDSGWNFGWDTVVSAETVANKVDFLGTADDRAVWHVGTESDDCAVSNTGWGVGLQATGKGNVSYMYNKVRIPPQMTEFRVWAVGNKDYVNSGEGAMRTVAVYKDESGQYIKKVLTPLASSFGASSSTKFYAEDGTIRFSNAAWSMPGVKDGMIYYDVSDLPKGQDVVIFIESVGMGNVVGDEYTEAAEGTPVGEVMSDLVIVKRVIVVASSVPVDEGTEISVPEDGGEQELLFKIADQEGLYLNFLPPTTKKYEKAPVLLLICGGGWTSQSRASILSMMNALVSDLRAEGFAVVAADYRVITSTNNLMVDQQVTDLMDALRYVVHYADVLGIDPERIATSGHSAGAHLAMMVAHAHQNLFPSTGFADDYKVFACVPFAARGQIHGSARMYIATTADGIYHQDIAELCSPYTHIRADNAPTLMLHGNMDEVIPFSEATMCMAKAAEVGAPYELLVSEYGNHSFVSAVRGHKASPDLTEANHIAADWIVQQLEILNAK